MSDESDELEQLEEELAELETSGSLGKSSYGSPTQEKKDGVFKFFREILHLPETWKVGNLNDTEMGKYRLGVRSYLQLARYAKSEKLDLISEYFTDQADIVAAPTMGRKGFFLQTAVTNIRKEQKIGEPVKKKKGLFSFGGNNNEPGP